MALSGQLSVKSSRGNYYYVVDWTATQDIDNNKSTITMQHYLNADAGWDLYLSSTSGSYSQINGGNTQYYTHPSISIGTGGGSKHLGTTQHEVYHNSDGTATISLSARMNSPYLNYPSSSSSVTLDTIPRTSSFTIEDDNIDFGNTLGIKITKANASFTHRITYTFFNQTYSKSNVEAEDSYQIPLEWMAEIPNAVTGSGLVTVDTYNGEMLLGSSTNQFTLNVPISITPTFDNLTVQPSPELSGFEGVYIQGQTGIKATVNNPSGVYGSTISKYSIVTSAGNVGSSQIYTTPILNTYGSVVVTATITDSRNRSYSQSISVNYEIYQEPRLSEDTIVQRVNASGQYDPNGTRVAVSPTMIISSVSNKNAIQELKYRYKQNNSVWSQEIDVASSSTSYFDASADYTYEIEILYKDKVILSTLSKTFEVSTTVSFIDLKGNGRGMAFGKSAEIDDVIEIAWAVLMTGGFRCVEIPNGADLNSFTTPGFYATPTTTTELVNSPTTNPIIMKVTGLGSGSWVCQELIVHPGISNANLAKLMRVNGVITPSGWTAWQSL